MAGCAIRRIWGCGTTRWRKRSERTRRRQRARRQDRAAPPTPTAKKRQTGRREASTRIRSRAWAKHADALTAQLDDLEQRKKDGKLQLPDGDTLDVTNLQKIFWPGPKYTKGDLLRYYARIAPLHPAGHRRAAAGHEALPQRRRRRGVLSASRARRLSAGRARRADRPAPTCRRCSSAAG